MTELVFILDRSGSMYGLEQDTIGGFNSMIEKQKQQEGDAFVTTILFDNRVEMLHDRLPLTSVNAMTDKDYTVRGSTALLDAVGSTIHHIAKIHKYAHPDHRPEKTLFVIITDGMENASRKYTYDMVKELISHEQEKYGWEFLFLGANIDAAREGARFGIRADRTATYLSDNEGTALNYEVISDAVSQVRACAPLSADWNERINADKQKRSRR
ncbi:MAG: VWA domain-containing protein [Oscillospiraceae bacterium]|nr:VWA domain-containing protein [Oscillospiraceae bacterium]